MKKFLVQLNPGYPGRSYQRAGHVFTSHAVTKVIPTPLVLTEDEITEEMRSDPWLTIEQTAGTPDEAPPPAA